MYLICTLCFLEGYLLLIFILNSLFDFFLYFTPVFSSLSSLNLQHTYIQIIFNIELLETLSFVCVHFLFTNYYVIKNIYFDSCYKIIYSYLFIHVSLQLIIYYLCGNLLKLFEMKKHNAFLR